MEPQAKTKKVFAVVLGLISGSIALAQQQLSTNQNYWFLAQENIAAIRDDAKLNAQGLYRRNWLRFDQSPELLICRIEASKALHGWDMNVVQYSNAFYRRQDLKLGWRYSLKLDEKQKLNFGARIGLLRTAYSWANLNAQNPEELPELYKQNSRTNPAADFGLQYTFNAFQFSLHANNLNINTKDKLLNEIQELPAFAILTSYNFKISKLTFTPFVQLRSVFGLPITSDFSFLLEKEKVIGLQCGFKNKSAIYSNLRFFAGPQLAFSMSYAYPIAVNQFTGPATEIAIVLFTK